MSTGGVAGKGGSPAGRINAALEKASVKLKLIVAVATDRGNTVLLVHVYQALKHFVKARIDIILSKTDIAIDSTHHLPNTAVGAGSPLPILCIMHTHTYVYVYVCILGAGLVKNRA